MYSEDNKIGWWLWPIESLFIYLCGNKKLNNWPQNVTVDKCSIHWRSLGLFLNCWSQVILTFYSCKSTVSSSSPCPRVISSLDVSRYVLYNRMHATMSSLFYLTFAIFGASDAPDSKSGSSITNDSISWATGPSGSVSESPAIGETPFFFPCCWVGCSSVGIKVRKMGAVGWSRRADDFDATFGLDMQLKPRDLGKRNF